MGGTKGCKQTGGESGMNCVDMKQIRLRANVQKPVECDQLHVGIHQVHDGKHQVHCWRDETNNYRQLETTGTANCLTNR